MPLIYSEDLIERIENHKAMCKTDTVNENGEPRGYVRGLDRGYELAHDHIIEMIRLMASYEEEY